jgi:hypothetical protein
MAEIQIFEIRRKAIRRLTLQKKFSLALGGLTHRGVCILH